MPTRACGAERDRELELLRAAAAATVAAGLELHAGHGLNYQNVAPVARLPRMEELNIGHSIISRAVFVGLKQAVFEMKSCIASARFGSRREPGISRCPRHDQATFRWPVIMNAVVFASERGQAISARFPPNSRERDPLPASLWNRTTIRFVIL